MSHPSFTGDANDEDAAIAGFVTGVVLTTEVGNCRLLQTVCVPMMGVMCAGVEVAYPEPAGTWLGEETVGLTDGLDCDMLLLESTVGALVICHKFEPSGMRAYD